MRGRTPRTSTTPLQIFAAFYLACGSVARVKMRRAAATEFSRNISLFVGDTVPTPCRDLTSTIGWKAKARLIVRSTRKEEMVLHNEGGNDEPCAFRRNNERTIDGDNIFYLFSHLSSLYELVDIRDALRRVKFSPMRGVI